MTSRWLKITGVAPSLGFHSPPLRFNWPRNLQLKRTVRNTVDTVTAFTYLPVLSTLQLAQDTYGRENKKEMDHYDPFHLHTYVG